MSDIPLSVILSWPEPNFDDPETHGKGFLAGSIILAVAGCTAVGLRLWARFGIVRKPGPDDYLIILALVCVNDILEPSSVVTDGSLAVDLPRAHCDNTALWVYNPTIMVKLCC